MPTPLTQSVQPGLTGTYDQRYQNALRNAGGNVNSPLMQQWLGQYGPGGANPTGTPFGGQAAQTNAFMTSQSVLPYMQNLPGYQEMVSQRSENAMDMLQGQVPDDVINQIATQAAERGISGGVPQSPNANAAYLRSLGLTSLDLMGQGSKELSQSISDTPVPELFNPASLWAPEYSANRELAQVEAGRQRQLMDARNRAASEAWNSNRPPQYSTHVATGFLGR